MKILPIKYDLSIRSGLNTEMLMQLGEKNSIDFGFDPKDKSLDSIREVLKEMGGRINYADPFSGWEWGVVIHGVKDFEIFVSEHLGSGRMKFDITLGIAQYFMCYIYNLSEGNIEKGTGMLVHRYLTNHDEQIIKESVRFAVGFLMPRLEIKRDWVKLNKEDKDENWNIRRMVETYNVPEIQMLHYLRYLGLLKRPDEDEPEPTKPKLTLVK